MGKYSIKDLEKLSGVKAGTLRIWEQRYDLIIPERTETNIRFYSDDELRKLLNITVLLNGGMKISKIAKLKPGEFKDHLFSSYQNELKEHDAQADMFIKNLIVAMIDFDEAAFNKIFKKASERLGFSEAYKKVLYPFLYKVGLMWNMDEINPAQEHFITHLIRQKVIAEIDRIEAPENPQKTFLLYLHEEEFHELGLLISYYLIKLRNHRVYYLGQNVPFEDVVTAGKHLKPDYVVTFYSGSKSEGHNKNLISQALKRLPDTDHLYSCFMPLMKEEGNLHYLGRMDDLENFL
ncbi:MAG TPA: hypothetical protein DCS15_06540 [Flavobacteriales bacterium]|jgi:DNA-binding transcriptional MerR regulator|nr:MerR family transcriptional regulator [Salibacteraceae bacterium]HAS36126.1 hypothetical protein [Flavobacteriales bacterium]